MDSRSVVVLRLNSQITSSLSGREEGLATNSDDCDYGGRSSIQRSAREGGGAPVSAGTDEDLGESRISFGCRGEEETGAPSPPPPARLNRPRDGARWHIALADVPPRSQTSDFRFRGNDGVEIGNVGAIIVHFSLMSAHPSVYGARAALAAYSSLFSLKPPAPPASPALATWRVRS